MNETEKNNENIESKLLNFINQKEELDKKLLRMEIVIGVTILIMYLGLVTIVSLIQMMEWVRTLVILVSTICLVVVAGVLLKIEQLAGYYECKKCHYKYVPKYSKVLWAMHICRTRYMRCPKCKKTSWQKKVISNK